MTSRRQLYELAPFTWARALEIPSSYGVGSIVWMYPSLLTYSSAEEGLLSFLFLFDGYR